MILTVKKEASDFFETLRWRTTLIPFETYPDMKFSYPIQNIHLRFQLDDIDPKKYQFFEEYWANPANASLFYQNHQIKGNWIGFR